MNKTLLGTDRHGFSYYEEGHYVIQYRANGELVGYLCSTGAWERGYKTAMIPGRADAVLL